MPDAPWNRNDLVRRLCLSLAVADRAVTHLGETGYRDEDDLEGSFGPDKPLAETAMLLHVARAAADDVEVRSRVDELALRVAALARSHRTACAIALHPTICFQLAMPHILLGVLGLGDARLDRVLSLSAEAQSHGGREIVPHRDLEVLWLKSLWCKTVPDGELVAAASRSILNSPVDLLWGSREDAYAHTHAFMYASNFGYWRLPLPRPRADVLGDTAGLLARSLLLEDFDLAAELLMAWPLTSTPWTPSAAFGFRVLAEFEDKVGYLPAGNGAPERFARLAGREKTTYALAAAYHTAYVMGMLCGLALRPGNPVPDRIVGPLWPAALIDRLQDMIPRAATPWQQTFDGLGSDERRALAPFLLDVALLARVRSHDFSAAAQLLRLAVEHGLAGAPCCAQTAELLQRMAACAEA
jgi:hypothetical protein